MLGPGQWSPARVPRCRTLTKPTANTEAIDWDIRDHVGEWESGSDRAGGTAAGGMTRRRAPRPTPCSPIPAANGGTLGNVNHVNP